MSLPYSTLQTSYGFEFESPYSFDQTVSKVRDAFKAESFGVLTEIDVQSTLREKIGADTEPYVILGMCNPIFAHRAMEDEPMVGLLLPCNVVVRQSKGHVLVDVQDPAALMHVVGNPVLEPIGQEVGKRVRQAAAAAVA